MDPFNLQSHKKIASRSRCHSKSSILDDQYDDDVDIEDDIASRVRCTGGKDVYLLADQDSFEDNFYCPRCARVFRTKGGMLRHHRIECVDKPRFQCPHCDMKSKYTQAIYRHIRSRHKGSDVGFIMLF